MSAALLFLASGRSRITAWEAQLFLEPIHFGDFSTTYKSTAYPSFLDSGSNANLFSRFNHYRDYPCAPKLT